MLSHGGGILVPANNAEELGSALQKLVQDERYREELGAAARASFRDHFLWSIVRNQYQKVVGGLLA
jgi:glycosyltransferase involved in cell wall biosynthesis